jgi:hypothetical protein
MGEATEMPKTTKTRAELEAIVLAEVRNVRHCEDARQVTVIGLDDDGFDATWAVSNFNPGESDLQSCEDALHFIVPRLQNQFDLGEG